MKDYLQHLLALLCMICMTQQAAAQVLIQGTVVNKANQPVEGAKVGRQTVTDQEGRFALKKSRLPRRLRVSHPNYNIGVFNVPKDESMFIRLTSHEEEPWDYRAWHPFVGVNLGFIYSEGGENDPYGNQKWGVTCRTLGVMAGMMDDRFGFYGRGHFIPLDDDDDFDIRSRHHVFDFAVGGILHIWKPVWLYAGTGAMFYKEHTDNFSDFGVRGDRTEETFSRVILDAGLMLRPQKGSMAHWMVNIGFFTPFERYSFHPNVGVGYIF